AWSFFFQAEDGIRDFHVTGVQTCALPIWTQRRTVEVEVHAIEVDRDRGRRRRRLGLRRRRRRRRSHRSGRLRTQRDHHANRRDRSEERRVGKEGRTGGETYMEQVNVQNK